jgi:dTDP-4-dehydrorhamnose reductase
MMPDRKLLLFGGYGQVGTEIRKRATTFGWSVVAPSQAEADITKSDDTRRFIVSCNPDAVVNAAAYTAVDKAESDSDRAYSVNAHGAYAVSLGCSELGVPLIHFSTDYVYSGTGSHPLSEDSLVDPINEYGRSKLEGEELIQKVYPNLTTILRTSSVFGIGGHNFVKTMLKLFSEKGEMCVVSDQIMSPTWAGWDAEVVLRLLQQEKTNFGIFNCACAGAVSWHEFACAIRDASGKEYEPGKKTFIQAISASDYVTPARRPLYSALDCGKLETRIGVPMMSWKEGLAAFLEDFAKEETQ